jgi:hypothetical protein
LYAHSFVGTNTSEQDSGVNSFYLYGSTSGLDDNARMYMEVELTINDKYIQGFTKTSIARTGANYGHHTLGNFVASASDSFGAFTLLAPLQSGTCKIYGRRHRSAS